MKRCPQCNRFETDEALKFCRLDGATLVTDSSSPISEAGTAKLESAAAESETISLRHTTDAAMDRTIAPPAALPPQTTPLPIRGELSKSRYPRLILIALAALALVAAGVVFGLYKFSLKRPAPFQSITVTKLTNIGNATTAQISPNGEYVAHVVYEGGKNSVRVWDVATKSNVEIIPPTEDALAVYTFSPDSRYIYYRRSASGRPAALYQVAVFGGTSKQILETENLGLAFSPDGKQFASMRRGPGQGETSIIIANADGTDERILATRKGSERFGTLGLSWSPDGKVVACGVNIGGGQTTIAAVSVTDGTVKPITSQKWLAVYRSAWLHDGSGLVFSAGEPGVAQIWYVSYPGGDVHRITNDVNSHGSGSVSLTADSSTIATLQIESVSNIFVAPADNALAAKRITPLSGSRARDWGICWTPDGKIVHSTIASGNSNIWIMDADGRGNRQLTNDLGAAVGPVVSPDGRYVVFNSTRDGQYNLWRMDMDGSHPKQISDGGDDEAPRFSPDGRWVIYDAITTSDLRKVPIDGGVSVRLTDRRVVYPTVSPKDGMIAGLYRSDENAPPRLAVFPPDGGAPARTFDVPSGALSGALWTPDGRTIVYLITRAETSSLWSQSRDGGAPKQLADFSPEQIFSFDLSRDGKWFAFARGTVIRDVILITDSGKQ